MFQSGQVFFAIEIDHRPEDPLDLGPVGAGVHLDHRGLNRFPYIPLGWIFCPIECERLLVPLSVHPLAEADFPNESTETLKFRNVTLLIPWTFGLQPVPPSVPSLTAGTVPAYHSCAPK